MFTVIVIVNVFFIVNVSDYRKSTVKTLTFTSVRNASQTIASGPIETTRGHILLCLKRVLGGQLF